MSTTNTTTPARITCRAKCATPQQRTTFRSSRAAWLREQRAAAQAKAEAKARVEHMRVAKGGTLTASPFAGAF